MIILVAVLVGLYLIAAVGYHRMLVAAINENDEARVYSKVFPRLYKVFSVFLSVFWLPQVMYTYLKLGVARG